MGLGERAGVAAGSGVDESRFDVEQGLEAIRTGADAIDLGLTRREEIGACHAADVGRAVRRRERARPRDEIEDHRLSRDAVLEGVDELRRDRRVLVAADPLRITREMDQFVEEID